MMVARAVFHYSNFSLLINEVDRISEEESSKKSVACATKVVYSEGLLQRVTLDEEDNPLASPHENREESKVARFTVIRRTLLQLKQLFKNNKKENAIEGTHRRVTTNKDAIRKRIKRSFQKPLKPTYKSHNRSSYLKNKTDRPLSPAPVETTRSTTRFSLGSAEDPSDHLPLGPADFRGHSQEFGGYSPREQASSSRPPENNHAQTTHFGSTIRDQLPIEEASGSSRPWHLRRVVTKAPQPGNGGAPGLLGIFRSWSRAHQISGSGIQNTEQVQAEHSPAREPGVQDVRYALQRLVGAIADFEMPADSSFLEEPPDVGTAEFQERCRNFPSPGQPSSNADATRQQQDGNAWEASEKDRKQETGQKFAKIDEESSENLSDHNSDHHRFRRHDPINLETPQQDPAREFKKKSVEGDSKNKDSAIPALQRDSHELTTRNQSFFTPSDAHGSISLHPARSSFSEIHKDDDKRNSGLWTDITSSKASQAKGKGREDLRTTSEIGSSSALNLDPQQNLDERLNDLSENTPESPGELWSNNSIQSNVDLNQQVGNLNKRVAKKGAPLADLVPSQAEGRIDSEDMLSAEVNDQPWWMDRGHTAQGAGNAHTNTNFSVHTRVERQQPLIPLQEEPQRFDLQLYSRYPKLVGNLSSSQLLFDNNAPTWVPNADRIASSGFDSSQNDSLQYRYPTATTDSRTRAGLSPATGRIPNFAQQVLTLPFGLTGSPPPIRSSDSYPWVPQHPGVRAPQSYGASPAYRSGETPQVVGQWTPQTASGPWTGSSSSQQRRRSRRVPDIPGMPQDEQLLQQARIDLGRLRGDEVVPRRSRLFRDNAEPQTQPENIRRSRTNERTIFEGSQSAESAVVNVPHSRRRQSRVFGRGIGIQNLRLGQIHTSSPDNEAPASATPTSTSTYISAGETTSPQLQPRSSSTTSIITVIPYSPLESSQEFVFPEGATATASEMNVNRLTVRPQEASQAKAKAVEDARQMQAKVNEECKKSGKDPPPYGLEELIGKGSFGRVYKGKDMKSAAVVAVKIIDIDESDTINPRNADSYSEFLKEVNALKILGENKAKNINLVIEALPVNQAMWMITEYCGGGSVATLVSGDLTWSYR
ncbi:serine/threonine protein kinase [Diplocarpon rosae]|nr:serine/threonine protein kinase [Diplocarpon rosae]